MDVSVVIGGSAGIGQAAAVEIAARGAGVVLTYRRHPEGADETVARIERLGGSAVALPLDVGDSATFPAFRDRVADALATTWGADRITSLVNNAGIGQAAPIEDASDELWEGLHRVLLKGPFFLTQALLPLLADGGAIVTRRAARRTPPGSRWATASTGR